MTAFSDKKLIANGRIWIDTQDGPFLGYGRIELLEKIKEFGSIRQAALDMKMSYRQAWQLVDQMNHLTQQPLVVSKKGGKGGGYATVTETGEEAMVRFKEFNDAFQMFLNSYSTHLNK